MTQRLPSACVAAFIVGLCALAWVAAGYLPGQPLALLLLLPIAAAYLVGARELQRFQYTTQALAQALASATTAAPTALEPWLATVPAGLRQAVRLRVEGQRVGLPGPALTPYLVGLLVLLGMLGTFLGMVATLKGTGLALENAADVDAIRASLAAPVKGLGLAFGASVAGVATSAMLGLMSALVRRDRQRLAQQLDALAATTLHGFSRAQQEAQAREEGLRLQREQGAVLAAAVPALVAQWQGLAAQLERQAATQHERLLAAQAQFQGEAQRAYTALAESVGHSLQTSLATGVAESARLAGEAIAPAVQATLAGLARESSQQREALGQAVQNQLEGASAHLHGSTRTLLDAVAQRLQRGEETSAQAWRDGFTQQQASAQALMQHTRDSLAAALAGFEQQAAALLQGVAQTQAASATEAAAREHERMQAFHTGLAAMTLALQQQARQEGQALAERQQQICQTLEDTAQRITTQTEAQARATLGEVQHLLQTAAEAPRAAAEVISELRRNLSDSLVRDNAVLAERNQLMTTLGTLLDTVNHAGREQRAAIDALVHTTTHVLEQVGSRFSTTVEAEARTLQAVAVQVTGSAAEVASLGEGFNTGVQLFSRASEQLMAQLQRLEGALGQSMARSDEQLAYYVAQAREIIDLTLGSQKQIVDDLQKLSKATAMVS